MIQLIFAIISIFTLYAMGAFIGWELDPEKWSWDARALIVLLWFVAWGSLFSWYLDENKK